MRRCCAPSRAAAADRRSGALRRSGGNAARTAAGEAIVGVLAASRELLAAAAGAVAGGHRPGTHRRASPPRGQPVTTIAAEMGDEIWRQFLSSTTPALRASWRRLKLRDESARGPLADTARRRRSTSIPAYVDLRQAGAGVDQGRRAPNLPRERHLRGGDAAFRTTGRFEPWPHTYPDYAAPAAFLSSGSAECASAD